MRCRFCCYKKILLAVAVIVCSMSPVNVFAEEKSPEITVEYGELRNLLKTGNPTLKQVFDEYGDELSAYQEMWDVMKFQQGNLEDKAEEAKDEGEENAAVYASNAQLLKTAAGRIYKSMENMKTEKSTRSMENSADSYTLTAQTVMNSYNQMSENVEVQEKSAEALRAVYAETVKKLAVGSATQADAVSAEKNLTKAVNSLETLREEEEQLKLSLLTMLGLQGNESVTIGKIPEPDLSEIEAIDLEADKKKAISNSSEVQEARHSTAYSTVKMNQRARLSAEAEETAVADIQEAYDTLMVKKVNYQAALTAFQGSLSDYQSLQRRLQAGMLSNVDYINGEAEFMEKKAAKEIASMNLVQAYESYCWEAEGID